MPSSERLTKRTLICVFVCTGDLSARPWFIMLARHDTKRAEAAVVTVRRVGGPFHMSHHNWGLLQTV